MDKTYEHQVYRRMTFDRGSCTWTSGVFDCSTVGLVFKFAKDFRRFAAKARVAKFEVSTEDDGGACIRGQVRKCACAVATCKSLELRLRRSRASHVGHRPSMLVVLRLYEPTSARLLNAVIHLTDRQLNWSYPTRHVGTVRLLLSTQKIRRIVSDRPQK